MQTATQEQSSSENLTVSIGISLEASVRQEGGNWWGDWMKRKRKPAPGGAGWRSQRQSVNGGDVLSDRALRRGKVAAQWAESGRLTTSAVESRAMLA